MRADVFRSDMRLTRKAAALKLQKFIRRRSLRLAWYQLINDLRDWNDLVKQIEAARQQQNLVKQTEAARQSSAAADWAGLVAELCQRLLTQPCLAGIVAPEPQIEPDNLLARERLKWAAARAGADEAGGSLLYEPNFTEAEIAVLRTSMPFAEWGEPHERGLAYMRQQRDAALRTNASLAPSAEMASDLRMWRFLVATSFRAAEAAKMYTDALAWRAEWRIDAMRDALVEANPAFFGGGAAGLQMPHIHAVDTLMMKARPRTWYRVRQGEAAGGEKGSAVTSYEPLLDKGGNLVYIEVPSAFDAAAMSEMEAEYIEAEFRAHELLQLVIDELSRRQGRMCLIFRVLDLHGFSLTGSLFASAEVKQGEALVKQVGKEVKDAYPTTTFKNFLINAPAASFAGPLVAALVPKRSRDKTVIKGADYAPELHKWIEPANLPQKLGGSLDDGLQWRGMGKQRGAPGVRPALARKAAALKLQKFIRRRRLRLAWYQLINDLRDWNDLVKQIEAARQQQNAKQNAGWFRA